MTRRYLFGMALWSVGIALIPTLRAHEAEFGPQPSEFTKPVNQSVTIIVEGSVIGSSPEKLARELEALLEPDDAA